MISHLIFDFFGTLVAYSPSRISQGYLESHRLYAANGGQLGYSVFLECWAAAFSELDRATAESHREYSMVDAARCFCRHSSFACESGVLADLASVYVREWSQGVRYIEGLSPMLGRLAQRYNLSVVTNTHDPDLVPCHLRAMGVEPLFSQVVTSIGFGMRKPSPAIFEFALREMSVAPSACVYVGDSLVPDFEGPRAVGIRPLLVDRERQAPVDSDQRVDSILELEAILAEF